MIYPEILKYIEEVKPLVADIPEERKESLEKISGFIYDKSNLGEKADLIYICTHNSRRSHFGQVWAQVLAKYYNFDHVQAFSGGTEVTAVNTNALKAITSAGFKVKPSQEGNNPDNPLMEIYYGEGSNILTFSKIYNESPNPTAGFCAIMTCSDAEERCPFIPGAALRVATPYDDPKHFDNTPQQDQKYSERLRQIASEIYFMYSLVK